MHSIFAGWSFEEKKKHYMYYVTYNDPFEIHFPYHQMENCVHTVHVYTIILKHSWKVYLTQKNTMHIQVIEITAHCQQYNFQTLFSASCKSEFVKLYETLTEQLVWYWSSNISFDSGLLLDFSTIWKKNKSCKRKTVQKLFFLGLCPNQRTTPTHPKGLGRQK